MTASNRFVAVFLDGAVSLTYPTPGRLRRGNDFRWANLYRVVAEEDIDTALHELGLDTCVCNKCVVESSGYE